MFFLDYGQINMGRCYYVVIHIDTDNVRIENMDMKNIPIEEEEYRSGIE